MKVLGILGSPHKDGGSAQLLLAALKGAQREGSKIELVSVYDGEIKPCIGCIHNEDPNCKFPCIFEDYGKILLEKIYQADGIIFSTPVYWFAPSGPLKILIDRMTCLENMVAYGEPSYMEGKVVGAIAVGADEGAVLTTGYLITTMSSMGAIIPPWGIAYSLKSKNAIRDDKALMDAINIGLLMAKLIAILKGEKRNLTFIDDKNLLEEIRKEIFQELKQFEVKENYGKRTISGSRI
ncbi:flavodoxin family protein [Thermodesulfobacterium hydrogeniphilum]|uniref:flavodoxin family protein n=1 Tax=Thermodesulfobacterium hydrogeniphilum TaxID=161156 RepID=UPI000571029B|nr:flavodoxin family protein [Thermodesulfobacterium hydrogeniphilum]